jgi:beta-galactosidase
VPFSSKEAATTALKNGTSRHDSDRLQMLCGDWSFRYYQSVADVDIPFWNAPFENTIPVPAMWQLHGYDVPQYVNMDYPFPFDPPYVPLENPCGAYHTQFTVDAAHRDERCYLNFEGVQMPVPCEYDYMLKTVYGKSYDTIPPVRVTNMRKHAFELNKEII